MIPSIPPIPSLWLGIAALIIAIGFFVSFKPRDFDLPKGMTLGVLAALVLFGGYLRFSVLDFGFPEFYHPDESTKARVLKRMAARESLDPKYFLHPSLLLYSAKVTSRVLREAGVYENDDPHRYVLAGRFVSATAGTISIYLMFLLGRSFNSTRKNLLGLLAAATIACSPLHLACSRYFKEDALFTTFLLCVVLASLRALRLLEPGKALRSRVGAFLAAGVFVGFCAGSKYTGGVSVLLPISLLLFFLYQNRFEFKAFKEVILLGAVTGFAAAIAFVFTTPFSILNFSEFIDGVLFERSHVLNGHGGIAISAWSQLWTYHLSRSLQRGLGIIPLFLALAGVGMALKRRAPKDLFILFALALFYAAAEYVKAKPMPQPDRYALPALIFLALLSVNFFGKISGRVPTLVLATLFIAIQILTGINETRALRPDTREKMSEWIQKNIPKSSTIVLVGLPYYAPRLTWDGYKVRTLRPENDKLRHTYENLRSSKHEYLLTTSLSYDRFFSQPFADQELKQRFVDYDREFQLVHLEETPQGSFGFHNPTLKLYKLR